MSRIPFGVPCKQPISAKVNRACLDYLRLRGVNVNGWLDAMLESLVYECQRSKSQEDLLVSLRPSRERVFVDILDC